MGADSKFSILQGRLDYTFRDPKILERALTHTSAGAVHSNERLEFLGDRVLGLAMAEMLLNTFTDEDEGAIARRFAELVRAERLTDIGRAVGVDAALKLTGQAANDGMVADATEAVIAALYLDGGFPAANQFIERHWAPLINKSDAPPRDAKTALQEWSQAQGIGLPKYRDVGREGPDHEPLFTVEVTVTGVEPARAQGTNKRAAEQDAAALLLAQLGIDDVG
ncbi:MAG: ribonuclease III [Alphaproteobacteria bacterium]|nr:ribonuclease III [Alphaproteobacteria bacterium]